MTNDEIEGRSQDQTPELMARMCADADRALGTVAELEASNPSERDRMAYQEAYAQFLYGWMKRNKVEVTFGPPPR